MSFTNFSFLLQQLYTAFFKNIEKQLKDKEFIFSVLKFLGYTERDEHKVYIKDSGRRNPIWASFNLFLLQVELQIMEEIQNLSRNIPLKEIVKARSKRRTMEEAIRYLDLKFPSKQDVIRGTSSDNIKARARLSSELASGDQTTTSSYSGSSANLSVLSKATYSGAADASNRSNEHTARNGYVPSAQLRITDNILYGVNPEESQPEPASAYDREVHDQTSLSSRYPDRCDNFRNATTREKTGNSQHVTTPPTGRPQYSANTKGGQRQYADSSGYTFHQLGAPHSPRLTNVGVKDPEVTGNSQHVTTPLTSHPQYSANTKGGQQHDADSSYYTFHQLGVPHCARLTNVGLKDPGVTGNSQHVTTPPTGRPQYSANTKGGQRQYADSSGYTFHQLGAPHSPRLTNVGVKDPEEQPAVLNNGHSFNSSAEAGTSVHGINTRYANLGSDRHNIRNSGSDKSLPAKEGGRRFEDGLLTKVTIESPVAFTAVNNISSGATEGRNHLSEKPPSPVQDRRIGDLTPKEDGSARHFPPLQGQNPTQGSVTGSQSRAVSVTKTTLSHEARAVKQTKEVEKSVCEQCLVPASCICHSCHRLICGKCKAIFAVDICAVTKGEHDFVNLTASERKGEQGNEISGGEWSCLRCTYVNPAENKICAMCSTTRGLSAVELSKPGSRVCSVCTYHNKENAKICNACSITLDLHGRETMC